MSTKPVDLFQNRYHRPVVKMDPLNDAQKLAIWTFVDRSLFSSEVQKNGFGQRKKTIFEAHIPNGSMLRACTALAKTYDSYDPEILSQIKAGFSSEEDFRQFRRILKNPAEKSDELLLDKTSRPQLFAAQLFMKVIIKNAYTYDRQSIQDHCCEYRKKMASSHKGRDSDDISMKNQLLMQDDPIEKLSDDPASPLRVILTHTFFQTPKITQTTTLTTPSWTVKEHVETFGPDREEARTIIRKLLTDLAQRPRLKHVIDALGTLILKEKGNVFFGIIEQLGKPYSPGRTGITGFYNQRHSIMMPHCVNPMDSKPCYEVLSTFVHEALHFIFNCVVQNAGSPVKKGSEEQALLDQALELDRRHREKIDPAQLKGRKSAIWTSIVSNLEREKVYFGDQAFDPNNQSHCHTMRVEAIVRIMEQTTDGATDEDLQAIAPNLFTFYYRYSKPLLERFVQSHAHLFRTGTSTEEIEPQPPMTTTPVSEQVEQPPKTTNTASSSVQKRSLLSSYWHLSVLFRIFSILSLGLLPLVVLLWETFCKRNNSL